MRIWTTALLAATLAVGAQAQSVSPYNLDGYIERSGMYMRPYSSESPTPERYEHESRTFVVERSSSDSRDDEDEQVRSPRRPEDTKRYPMRN